MLALLELIDDVIWLYTMVLIVSAVLSWLTAFGVVNAYNPTVRGVGTFCYRLTEPALRPIRSIIPNLGGIDISPIILILLLQFLRNLLHEYGPRLVF